MAAARFCSECGERLKMKRTSLLAFRSPCPRCSPRFTRVRLVLIATPFLCALFGFAIGHYTRSVEPFYFIGTPIQMNASGSSPSAGTRGRSSLENDSLTRPGQLAISPTTANAICGARTKAGKPCQRKVKGGGYCWQHRDKQPSKKEAAAGK